MRRKARVRAKIRGTETRPRFTVFRSHKHLYAQLIDDANNRVLAFSSDRNMARKAAKADVVKEIAKQIAHKAKEQHIEKIVFDRSSYAYHGTIKALAEELRAQGLSF